MNLEDFQVHPRTRLLLERLAASPSQGYLFVGPVGSGRHTLAEQLALHWAKGDHGLVHFLVEEDGSIGIDAVKKLRPLLNQAVRTAHRRTLIIDSAHLLTREAQNSLLKLMEEPPAALTFIAIAQTASDLLPTIESRLQKIEFYPLPKDQLLEWYRARAKASAEEANRLYHVGNRTPGGMLLAADTTRETLDMAKQFLQADMYVRSKLAAQLQKYERPVFDAFLQDVGMLAQALLNNAASSGNAVQARRFSDVMAAVLQARRDLAANVNQRLLLTQLVVDL